MGPPIAEIDAPGGHLMTGKKGDNAQRILHFMCKRRTRQQDGTHKIYGMDMPTTAG